MTNQPIAPILRANIQAAADEGREYFIPDRDATTIHDVVFFRQRNPKNIIHVGDVFLCDIFAGEMWLCELLETPVRIKERHQKLPIRPIEMIVGRDVLDRFRRWNGTWTATP